MEPSSKKRKVVTTEIPEQIVVEILSCLPIKSLLKFKVLSKSIASIITRPDFIDLHMERCCQSYELVTFGNDSKKYGYSSVLLSENDPNRSATVDLLNCEFLSTCRGIVLFIDNRPAVKQQIYFSNPSVRKTIPLPIINESFYYVFTAGLGFDVEANNYKVLTLSTNMPNKMYICRFSPNKCEEPIEWEDASSLAPPCCTRKKNVFMRGAIHWVAYKKVDEGHQKNTILVFNVKRENFSEMNFPSVLELTGPSKYLSGGDGFKADISPTHNQSICLVAGSFSQDNGFDIWVMSDYGKSISWSKISHMSPFNIPRDTDDRLNEPLPEKTWTDQLFDREIHYVDDKLDEPLGLRNGEAVWWRTSKGFLALHDATTGNIMYVPNIRDIQIDGLQLFPNTMLVAKYRESLVLLSKADFQDSTLAAPQSTLSYNEVQSNPFTGLLPVPLDGRPSSATRYPAGQKKIQVLNQHNEKLVGVLHDTGSWEIVVLCHGFKSSKDFNILVNLAVAMEKESISAFRFDFPGNGESEGLFQYGNYHRKVDDLHSVVKYFNAEGRKVTAILGHRKGGHVVLLYASMHHDVHTVINLSACYNLKEGIAEHLGKDFEATIKKYGYIDVKNASGNFDYHVTESSLMDQLATNMGEACLQIDKKCRVLTVHGSADMISSEDALEFNKMITNHKLHIIQGATHGYTSHQDELTSAILSFIKEGQLQN